MRLRISFVLLFPLLAAITACSPDASLTGEGPRLVGEREIAGQRDPNAVPTLFVLPTLTPVLPPTDAPPTEAPAQPIATADSPDFVLVTPTLQPSKTPTVTPTQTQIPTITLTPTTTVTAAATATDDQFVFNGAGGSSFAEATAIAQQARFGANPFDNPPPPPSDNGVAAAQCDGNPWWISADAYAPPACPQEQPITGHGVFQRFENGYMIWLEHNDKIYVMYQTAEQPRWQIFDDPYIEGEPELDYSWIAKERQPPQTYQPRRGFGEVWRNFDDARFRIGWAVQEWETIYTPRHQRGVDGSVTIEHPDGGFFYLAPRGAEWYLYLDRNRRP